MARGKPAFSPTPARAMSDTTLTALELRTLMCVSWHDRLSVNRGSKGCYASNRVIAEEVECTITSLSRALSILVKKEYIKRDRQGVAGKRHLTVYRVLHREAELVRRGKCSKANTPDAAPESFARAGAENTGNSITRRSQEISLSEETNVEESMGKNSIEMAHLAVRSFAAEEKSCPNEQAIMSEIERRLRGHVPFDDRLQFLLRLKRITESSASMAARQQALRLIDDIHERHWDH
jgi:DNA-binding MarR family transcriptional regulator